MDNGGTEALLAAPFAFPAKLVIFLPATLIKKERPFFLEVFRHTGHSGHLLIAGDDFYTLIQVGIIVIKEVTNYKKSRGN